MGDKAADVPLHWMNSNGSPGSRSNGAGLVAMSRLLDPIPTVALFLLFAIATLICYEISFRLGRWWQNRMPGDQEGPRDALVGSLLALLAFLLAVTMGMAGDRFDTRRGTVLVEANAIHATYLQADYLPPAQGAQIKQLVREYLPLRIATSDPARVQANIAQSGQLLDQMWTITADVVQTGYAPDLMSSFGGTLSDLVNVNQTRVTSAIYSRVPDTLLLLLFFGSALSLAMIGYGAGLKRQRSIVSAIVLILALGTVLVLVVDLDRPQDGLIRVSQVPLIDVGRAIGAQVDAP